MPKKGQRFRFYPRIIFHYLEKLAFEKRLPMVEIEYMFERELLATHAGFMCDHTNIGIDEGNEAHCNDCYTRMIVVKPQVVNFQGKVTRQAECEPKETFLDVKRKEDSQKARRDFEERVKAEVDSRIKALIDEAVRKERERTQGGTG